MTSVDVVKGFLFTKENILQSSALVVFCGLPGLLTLTSPVLFSVCMYCSLPASIACILPMVIGHLYFKMGKKTAETPYTILHTLHVVTLLFHVVAIQHIQVVV